MKSLARLLCLILVSLASFSSMIFGQNVAPSFAEQIVKHREEYKLGFLNNDRSPLGADDIQHLRFFEADEKYRVTCSFQRTPDEKPFDLPTYSGITRLYVKYGVLSFELDGQKLQLAVYQNLSMGKNPLYANHLFLPFRDATNDETTYAGGRYMDLMASDLESGAPVIDFNKCYNPWCHYSDGYNCPIPPVENTLDIPILAGERNWVGEKKLSAKK
ncbi:MAG: DUF1684 domain-containing protein [Saprospiraceae bacterium]|nr:DUF1684 domain-containing protein [Saprospiraceae bacterium]